MLPCNVPCEPHFTRRMGHLAAGHSKLENFDVAVRLLDDAIQIAERTNERFVEAELHRLRAEALQSSGLQRALAIYAAG